MPSITGAQMIDEGEAETARHHLRAGQPFPVRIVDRALIVVAVDDVKHATADAFDHGRGDRLRSFLVLDRLSAVLQRLHAHPLSELGHADGEAARGRAMLAREFAGERIRIFVDQEGAVALAIVVDRPRLVPRHLDETEVAEQLVQFRRLGRGEFDELEAVDAHRVLENHRRHAGWLGMRLHLCVHNRLRGAREPRLSSDLQLALAHARLCNGERLH